jgi:hypothetical protein
MARLPWVSSIASLISRGNKAHALGTGPRARTCSMSDGTLPSSISKRSSASTNALPHETNRSAL